MKVKEVLISFQKSTGQLLSQNKCSLLFSEASPSQDIEEIKEILGVVSASFENKYLGLPTPDGRMKDGNFQPIMERFRKRCTNWNERFMSQAAKEVNVKAVAQSLPTYVMGVFKLNKSFCDKYEKIIRDFWWGDNEEKRKVHWMSWEDMTKAKKRWWYRIWGYALFQPGPPG